MCHMAMQVAQSNPSNSLANQLRTTQHQNPTALRLHLQQERARVRKVAQRIASRKRHHMQVQERKRTQAPKAKRGMQARAKLYEALYGFNELVHADRACSAPYNITHAVAMRGVHSQRCHCIFLYINSFSVACLDLRQEL